MKRYIYQKSIQALHVDYNSMATIITERDVWYLDQQETEAKAERQGVKKMPGDTYKVSCCLSHFCHHFLYFMRIMHLLDKVTASLSTSKWVLDPDYAMHWPT